MGGQDNRSDERGELTLVLNVYGAIALRIEIQ